MVLTGGDPLQRCSTKVQIIGPVHKIAARTRGTHYPANADLPRNPDGSPNKQCGTSPPSRRRVHDTYWGRRWKGTPGTVWKDGLLAPKQSTLTGISLEEFPELELHQELLRAVFDNMRQWGENTVHDGLFSKQALRFVRGCDLVDSTKLTTAKLDLMFQRCLHLPPGDGGFIMGKTEMGFEQFQELLVEIAIAKFPMSGDPTAALSVLLREYVVPFAESMPKTLKFQEADNPAEINALVQEMDPELRFLFKVYSSRGIDLEENETSCWKEGMTKEQMRLAEVQRAREKKERYAERAVGLAAMDIRELVMFCEEFGVTGSLSHSNKATLVSNREVMRVARSVKSAAAMEKEHGLGYEDFLSWLQKLAIEAFKEEIHGLPTHYSRVEKLLLYIDSSPMLSQLRLGSGSTHRTNFTFKHKLKPMGQAIAELKANGSAASGAIVNRLHSFICAEPEREHDMRLVFEYYCSFGENAPRSKMKSQGLSKLCRDCDLFNSIFQPGHLDLVHIEAGSKQVNPRLSITQWVKAIADIARRTNQLGNSLAESAEHAEALYAAGCDLIENRIRPHAMKAVEMNKELALASHPQVVQVLEMMLPLLKRMFAYYCGSCLETVSTFRAEQNPRDAAISAKKALGVVEQSTPNANAMSFTEFVRLANDFHLVQRVGSMFDLGVYFRASAHKHEDKAEIQFPEFLNLMVRCALDYVDLDEQDADPTEAADGVLAFLSSFFKAHGITQLHRWFGDNNPLKRNADPDAFLSWMQDIMAGTSELQPGGRAPLRNMNKPTELDHTAMINKQELPDWARKLLNLPAFKESVYQVFDGYRQSHPTAELNQMPTDCFRDFCHAAKLFGSTFSQQQLNHVILKCTLDNPWMSATEFLTALHMVSSIKFGFEEKPSRGLVRVLREHLLPLLRAGECAEPDPEEDKLAAGTAESPSKARSVLDELKAGVGWLFRAYSTVDQHGNFTGMDDIGLLDFCTDHHILPGLVSEPELQQLVSTICKGAVHPLSQHEFLDWLGLCAQLAYRSQPHSSPSEKVEQLVDIIRKHSSAAVVGDWARPGYKAAFGIGLSNSGPRKVTAFSPLKASAELKGLANSAVQSTPMSVEELVHRCGHEEELSRIFQYYCGHGAGRPVNKLAGTVVNKLYKDCGVYDKHMKYEHMDIIFLEAAGGRRANPKLTLDLSQFLVALYKTACRKYPRMPVPQAWQTLLDECILPFAHREPGEQRDSLREQPGLQCVLQSNKQLLELIFAYYTDLDIDPRTSQDHLQDAVSMSFRELTLWAKDFGLIGTTYCEGISQVRMAKIFQVVAGLIKQNSGQEMCHIPFGGFEEVICRCAMQLLSTAYQSASVEERLATLISKLRAHRSMQQIETWLGRTQTNRTVLYRTKSNGTQHLLQPDKSNLIPSPCVKSVAPVTRRMTQRAEREMGMTPTPISFNADLASNPAMQSCLRGFYA